VKVLLRPFNGSLDDARGILAVDRATFNDCPYPPEHIVHLLTGGEQRAWVAEVDGSVVGFVTAFPTRTLQAESWEVDLLAVQQQHRRRGIGTALIVHAVSGAAGSRATRTRAVTAVKNHPSRRAFEAAGFQALHGTCHLMRCHVAGAATRLPVPGMEAVRTLKGEADARGVLRLAPALPHTAAQVARLAGAKATALLVAERDGSVAAFVELAKVQTLLYAGAWVETLVVPALSREGSRRDEAASLIAAAVEQVRAEGMDEIGCLVATQDWRLRQAFVGEGFVSAGEYHVLVQALP
jgi:GNAT superfamily N-acetyltransferase